MQTELAQRVAEALRVKLTDSLRARMALKTTKNFEAYQLFLEGTYLLHTRERENLRNAAGYFEKAIALDTNYARAYAGLADCFNLFAEAGVASELESAPKAREAALKALELDNNLAEAHAALALYKRLFKWDWPGAEQGFKKAIELDPNYPWARQWYSQLLMALDRTEQSIAEIKRAIDVDPFAANLHRNLGLRLWDARRLDESIEHGRKSVELFPDFSPGYWNLNFECWFVGRYEEAITVWERFHLRSRASPKRIELLRKAFREVGKDAYWQILLAGEMTKSKDQYRSPWTIAVGYAQLGQKELALDWLEKAAEERDANVHVIHVGPNLDSVRSDLRFIALLRKMGLEQFASKK